jgi:hypothetical protein
MQLPYNPGSLPFIWAGCHHPAQAAYPFRLLRCLGIHAGRVMRESLIGTYLALQPIRFTRTPCHHSGPWALTPHFHPYPPVGGRLFSAALSVDSHASEHLLPVRKYGALCCPDFPPPVWPEAAERDAGRLQRYDNFSTFAVLMSNQ